MGASAKPRYALVAGWDIKANGWGDFVNQNFCKLDNIIYPSVASVGQPPISNTPGVQFIDDQGVLQTFVDGIYVACPPRRGLQAWDETNGCMLVYDGTAWVDWVSAKAGNGGGGGQPPFDISVVNITDLLGIDTSGAVEGQTLCFNADGDLVPVNKAAGGGAENLSDLLDTSITTPADGETICYDAASSTWLNVPKEQASAKCCFPDPGGLSVGDPVRIDSNGDVVASDISDVSTLGIYVVISTDGTEVCIASFGFCDTGAPHGFTVGECYFEDANGGITSTSPSGINNILFHVVSDTKINVVAGTRPFQIIQ